MTAKPIEVSVVIPCLNEANSLAFCIDKALQAFKAVDISGEVVIGDNGSTSLMNFANPAGTIVVVPVARRVGSFSFVDTEPTPLLAERRNLDL